MKNKNYITEINKKAEEILNEITPYNQYSRFKYIIGDNIERLAIIYDSLKIIKII